MNKNKVIGSITELKIMTAFIELGYNVSTPYGDCEHYDFIADINGRLIRVQCKTATTYDNGRSIDIDFRKKTYTSKGETINFLYDPNEIDFVATYFNNKAYLVPTSEIRSKKRLRFDTPISGQQNYINMASEYEIERIIKKMEEV